MSFVSFLKAVGHDFKKGLDFLLYNPYANAAENIVEGRREGRQYSKCDRLH